MTGKTQNWHSIDIVTRPEVVEAIEFAFNSLGALGTATSFRRSGQSEGVVVSGYFDSPPDEQHFEDELHYALRSYGFDQEAITSVERATVHNQDWLAEWKKHWKPVTIGRFVVAPPWADEADGDKILIRIEPNMAFGTGTHETTQLCLSAIDRFYRPAESFLDVGTGTGILAIAAAKLANGSASVRGIDNDDEAVAIALQNVLSNGVEAKFEVGTISPDTASASFVCANLTLDVIEPILDLLLQRSERILILSGILAEQEPAISQALRARGVTGFSIEQQGEWIAVIVDPTAR